MSQANPIWAVIALDGAAGSERRAEHRITVHLGAIIEAAPGRTSRALIADISKGGMRLTTACSLEIGEEVGLYLPSGSLARGQIVWRDDVHYGVRFSTPLSKASVAAIRLASAPAISNQGQLKLAPGQELPDERALRNMDLLWIAPLLGAVNLSFGLLDLWCKVTRLLRRSLAA